MRRLVGTVAMLAVVVSCASSTSPDRPSRGSLASPSREPVFLEELAWERQVIDGLGREGIHVTLVGGSKFETLLGPQLPTRVFIVRAGAGGEGADVLAIDRPLGEIRVCTTQLANGFWSTIITVAGREVSRGEGSQRALYSVNDRSFVHAFGERFDAAIRMVLGTVRPPC